MISSNSLKEVLFPLGLLHCHVDASKGDVNPPTDPRRTFFEHVLQVLVFFEHSSGSLPEDSQVLAKFLESERRKIRPSSEIRNSRSGMIA